MIYIIADDLTGANDTGVQFAQNGCKTIVSIYCDRLSELNISEDLDVFVIDTETREVESRVARIRLKNILEKLNINDKDIVYKKVDSTLRGNIGAEIEEIVTILEKDICILSPSFPPYRRITVDGNLIVKGKSLKLPDYSSDIRNYKNNSSIEYILKKQSTLPIAQIGINDVNKGVKDILKKIKLSNKKGKKIIIIDSISGKDLKKIIQSSLKFKGSILFSGSAGLAKYLSKLYEKKRNCKMNICNNIGPVLVIAGSRSPIMMEQIKYLKSKMVFGEIKIDLEQVFSEKNDILETYVSKGINAIEDNYHLMVYTDTIYNEKNSINEKIMLKKGLCFRELEVEIKNIFSGLASKIIKKTNVRNLILTGGDIALGVCKELGISNLHIINELLPGIPLSVANYDKISLNIITKAGGFGTKNTLYQLMEKLKNY